MQLLPPSNYYGAGAPPLSHKQQSSWDWITETMPKYPVVNNAVIWRSRLSLESVCCERRNAMERFGDVVLTTFRGEE